MGQIIEGRKERRGKLLYHYQTLAEVFLSWRSITPNSTTKIAENFKAAMVAVYLNGWSTIQGVGHLHEWALEHVKYGYSELYADFNKLKALEDENNQFANTVITAIETEVNDILIKLPNLQPYQPTSKSDYYYLPHLLQAVQSSGSLSVASGSLLLNGGTIIAVSNNSTLTSLMDNITEIRKCHDGDQRKLKANAELDKKLILEIHNKVSEIIFEVDTFERLKGDCGYERSF